MKVLLWVLVAIAVLLGAFAAIGAWKWSSTTDRLRAQLERQRVPRAGARFVAEQLEGLPAPVARYLRLALTPGQPRIEAVRLTQTGELNLGTNEPRWSRFTADQRVIVSRPGFDWDARVRTAPLLTTYVRDAYVDTQGWLHASLLGMVTVVNERDSYGLNHGELMRFLAEAPWYPTVLLPGGAVEWSEVDDRSARATLDERGLKVTLLFSFGNDGMVEAVRAERGRVRLVDGQPISTVWEGRFWAYRERAGMRVPLEGEVAWIPESGRYPYWRGRIRSLEYEPAP